MQSLNKKKFQTAAIISFILAVIILSCSFIMGKQELFLHLNANLGTFADYLFATATYGGDGIIWILALLIAIFVLKRNDTLILFISGFVISTIIAQGLKNIFDEDRPFKAITNHSLIHTVPGVEIYSEHSFPSGHTTTAFCVYLIFCLLIPKKWWIAVGLIYALMVGYSRVYLAEHFPVDVGAGIICGIASAWFSMKVQEYFWRRKSANK